MKIRYFEVPDICQGCGNVLIGTNNCKYCK